MLTTKQFRSAFVVLILSLGLLVISSVAQAQGTIDVSDNATTAGTNWTYVYNNVTGIGAFTVTGDVTITGNTTINQVFVASGTTANITLQDVSIDLANTPVFGLVAFYMPDANVSLTIVGTNTLTSNGGFAGIQSPNGSILTINGTNADTLTVIGSSAGIGGGGDAGTITINGGTINVTGGSGAGIGGGGGSGGVITINGGHVTATSVYDGAGIGGSGGSSSNSGGGITIAGGTVDAYGGQFGSGIGGGGNGNGSSGVTGGAGGTITITGGAVNATGGQYGAGIGGGGGGGAVAINNSGGVGGAGGDISISGGANVTATAGVGAAGIGGGFGSGSTTTIAGAAGVGGAGGNIFINDATVSAFGDSWGAGIGGGGGGAGGPAGFGAIGTGGAAGNILIYGESTQVTAEKGISAFAKDIGAGAGSSTTSAGSAGNVFVALIPANLTLSSPPAVTKNDVLFTASATTVDTVEMTLLAPFNAAPFGTGTFDLLSGLGPTGKTLSIITSFTAQTASFSLTGFSNSPITDTGTRLMISGTSVNFTALGDIVIDLAQITVTAPAAGAAPDIVANGTGNFTISPVTWSPADATFKSGTTYTASVTLTPNAGYTFDGGLTVASINGNTATVTYDAVSGTAVLTYQFMLRNPPANTPVPVLNSAMLLGLLTFSLMMVATFRQKWR